MRCSVFTRCVSGVTISSSSPTLIRSRSAGGVRVLNTAEGEEVVSVARVADQSDGNGGPEIETVENEG